jgi:hypothetical protein
MRRLLVIGCITAVTLPAMGAHRATVSQLEQTLSGAVAKHRRDADIARQLANLELSERLTGATIDQFISKFSLQPKTALALELLADESAVFDPPHSEFPPASAPDAEAQRRMLRAAEEYVAENIPRLPNLFATRSTVRFEDSAQVLHPGEWPVRAGFHAVGSTSRRVTVRDGQEVTDSPEKAHAESESQMGLISFGEFGPLLARTLADLGKGKIGFSHWEQSKTGLVAVYRYSVPRKGSHYLVHFCCIMDREYEGAVSFRNRNMPRYHSGNRNPVETTGAKTYDTTPAYHGTLAISPATGAIVRMTLDAELDPENPINRASTVVEYGSVTMGDETFMCPVRSLAISSQQGPPAVNGDPRGDPVLSINETTFTDYHRLGSSVRVLTGSIKTAEGGTPQQ